MARNQEKAQSMLFRFREAQAIEMGVGHAKSDRRPRMASSVSSLKDCERWRGEIMRDISRKVSKIQDAGLTDYEVRDLNDEINKLMREKSHWERQIVTLGGANYRRARQAMVDDEGREVPGTRGYKYFGRAKELPGVKELFNKASVQESEEHARNASVHRFRNQGPEYYGDMDEIDEELVKEEEEMELQGKFNSSFRYWTDACARLAEALDLPEDTPFPSFPKSKPTTTALASSSTAEASTSTATKRKADASEDVDADGDSTMTPAQADPSASSSEKRTKFDESTPVMRSADANPDGANEAATAAALSKFFGGVLSEEDMQPPRMPTKEEMEGILLDVRKRALLAEYGV